MSFLDFFKKKEPSFQQPEPANNSSARDLSGVLDSVGVGLIVIDENDCLLELNESSMGYLGLSENTIGSKAVEVIKSVDLINSYHLREFRLFLQLDFLTLSPA